ncbi:outer membrane beta-barrel protein [Maribellus maritimus]|uniref:outer membrane beta-barrel protein n=1 Tax=Maribellus maritimus TaxID=2870838 RepID=UPI001EEA4693|nr:outer membrane beta-barrel protein [Maribellus maritimus]MCG6187821.1 PorT family protein [Maribellus maritimus]
MKKQLLTVALLTIVCIHSFSQILFEKGYFISASNQKIDCLIKNMDWKRNPVEFEYKLTQSAMLQTATIETVKEFGINGVSKYTRAMVKIDRSSDNINSMSSERNPVFLEKRLFLKVLVEGEASLFLYEDKNLTRFFFKNKDSEVEQLVFKRYRLNNKIGKNEYYKQQLLNNFKSQNLSSNDVRYIKYNRKDLEQFFITANNQTGTEYSSYNSVEKKELFNLSLRPGLNASSLAVQNASSDFRNVDFENKYGLRLGIEAEFILPYYKNKWTIITEPTFQYYSSTKSETKNISGGELISEVNYQSIEIPVGVRHYFYLNEKSKFFVNVSYIFDFSSNSSIEFTRNDGSLLSKLEIEPRRNLALGIGYKFKDKYGLELRYLTDRELLGSHVQWSSEYRTFSVIFGYSLF